MRTRRSRARISFVVVTIFAIVAAFTANPGAGALQIDRRMIDRPHLKLAQRILGIED